MHIVKMICITHMSYLISENQIMILPTLVILVLILQHGHMTVTSEERVLDAILTWCMEACDCFNWTSVHELLSTSRPEKLFGGRLTAINTLLPFVRFPLVQPSVLHLVLPSLVILFSFSNNRARCCVIQ